MMPQFPRFIGNVVASNAADKRNIERRFYEILEDENISEQDRIRLEKEHETNFKFWRIPTAWMK